MMAEDILKITNPCNIFPNNQDEAVKVFRNLSMKYHPDHDSSPHATEAFIHIKSLYNKALDLIANGIWEEDGVKEITLKTGKKYRFRYDNKSSFELGETLVCASVVAYIIESAHKKLYSNAIKMIESLKYKTEDMRKEFQKLFPSIIVKGETIDGKFLVVMKKTSEVMPLQDALDYFDKTKTPDVWDKHAAWIQSRLNNILCYLNYRGIVHNGISTETVFISPESHSVYLYGGWWYAVGVGEKMISIPKKLYNYVPPTVLTSKIASQITDGELVKAVGRESLKKVKAPKPFENWLKFGASGEPVKDYKQWMEKVLPAAYGERKFVKLNLNYKDVYK